MSLSSEKLLELIRSTDEEDREISLLDIGVEFAKNIKLIALAPALAAMLAFIYSWYFEIPRYTASVSLIPVSSSSNLSVNAAALGGLVNLIGGGAQTQSTQKIYAYLHSDTFANVIEQNLDPKKKKSFEPNNLLAAIKAGLALEENKKSGVLLLKFTHKDSQMATEVANLAAAALNQLFSDINARENAERRENLEKLIVQAHRKTYQNSLIRDAVIQGLIREFESAWLAEQQGSLTIRIIDLAKPPAAKTHPKTLMTTVVVYLSLLTILILFVVLKTGLTNASKDPESIKKLNKIRASFSISTKNPNLEKTE